MAEITSVADAEPRQERWITDKSYYLRLLLLAIPIALQNLLTVSVELVDNISLGRLGDVAVSAAYLSNQANQVQACLNLGLTASILILGSQYWGRQDKARVRQVTSIAWRIGTVAAAFFAIVYGLFPAQVLGILTNEKAVAEVGIPYLRLTSLSYIFLVTQSMFIATLRIVQVMRLGTFVTALALILKLILNPILIFRLDMGLSGAGLSTLVVRIAGFILVSIYLLKKDDRLGFRLKHLLQFDRVLAGDFFRYGIPVILGDLTWGINVVARSSIRGHLGSEATAAVSMSLTLFSFVAVFIYAFRDVISIEIGRTVGENNIPRLKQMTRSFQICFVALGVFHSLMLLLFKEPFLLLYPNLSEGAKEIARQYMTVLSVTIIGSAYQSSVLTGIVRAGGQTAFVLFNDLIFCWLIVMPLSLLASNVLHAPVWVVLACLESDQVLKCIVAVVKTNRYKWIRNLTRDSDNYEDQPLSAVTK